MVIEFPATPPDGMTASMHRDILADLAEDYGMKKKKRAALPAFSKQQPRATDKTETESNHG